MEPDGQPRPLRVSAVEESESLAAGPAVLFDAAEPVPSDAAAPKSADAVEVVAVV